MGSEGREIDNADRRPPIDGRYVLEAELGRGGMGVVYRARHKFTGAAVALKLLHPHFSENAEISARFRAEARAPGAIAHPAIVKVSDAGQAPNGDLYLVMELLEGETLGARMERGRPPIGEVLRVVASALDALASAHAANVIHRDLKPENIFLTRPDGAVKILDFGIAKIAEPVSGAPGMTATGAMMGTVDYMSPEQIKDTARVDHRADLWSTAVILYQALTGTMPFPGSSHPAVVVSVLSRPADPPSRHAALPRGWDAFFAKAFAPKIQERFVTANEMAIALARLAEELPAADRPPPPASFMRAPVEVVAQPGPPLAPSVPPPALTAAWSSPQGGAGPPPGHHPSSRPPGPGTLGEMRSAPPPPLSQQTYPAELPRPAPAPQARRSRSRWVFAGVAAVLVLGGAGTLLALALTAGPDPQQRCDLACADLTACTGVTSTACHTACARPGPMRSYAHRRKARDCRGVAVAELGLMCSAPPAGHVTCRDVMTCETACAARGGNLDTCRCGCISTLSADHARELAGLNLCSDQRCMRQCRTSPNGKACSACLASSCRDQLDRCRAR